MVAMVTYFIRSPEWGLFVGELMGHAMFEDANLDINAEGFHCAQCAQEFIDTWSNPEMRNECFVEEGLL